MKRLLSLIVLGLLSAALAHAADPVVSNIRASQRVGKKLVDIWYDVTDADGDQQTITLWVIVTNSPIFASSVSGDVGSAILPGNNHHVVWNAGADWNGKFSTNVCFAITADDGTTSTDYLIVDLSAGPTTLNYPISYLSGVPADGWSDECKTTKLVLRRISAGTFIMGSPTNELGYWGETQHQVTLSHPFYIGVFEVTQKQWERVMGTWPSLFTNTSYRDSRPMDVGYTVTMRGLAGTNWPASGDVDADSFMGRLRARTGKAFDLPTEAQWEYACRAGTTTALNSGKNLTQSTNTCLNMSEVGRYWYNGGSNALDSIHYTYLRDASTSAGTAKVGSYLPNAWGLYDMHGNVDEWCLDWYGDYPGTVIDPKGASGPALRVTRGGGWRSSPIQCRAANRNFGSYKAFNGSGGLRTALPLGP